MSRIRIKNFGPVKEGYQENDGWMDIEKVTTFIGNQGSGKSTVAKLISTFTWIEKALTRGDYDAKWFTQKTKFRNQYLNYHRLENYFNNEKALNCAEIEYKGDAYYIKFKNGMLSIEEANNGSYPLPQIIYVPAERNFIANVINPKALKLTSEALVEFVSTLDYAKVQMKGPMPLPINDVDVEYDKFKDVLNIKGKDYKVNLTDASSGFQSLVPLYLVSWLLANSVKSQSEITKEPMSSDELQRFRKWVADIWTNDSLTDEQKRVALSVLSSKFNKTAFINIVEEPEQNLFPDSQKKILNSLLEFNNMSAGNKLIMTTHSPYIINYLTLAVKAFVVLNKIKVSVKENELNSKLNEIVPLTSTINPDDLVIYELDDQGNISKLGNYKGLPSDENDLNEGLEMSNDLFSKLLDIEDSCR